MDTEKLGFVLLAQLGISVAELDSDGVVKSEQLPKVTPESIGAEKAGTAALLVANLQTQIDELKVLIKKLPKLK